MTENVLQHDSRDVIAGRDCRFVALWAAGFIVLYVVAGCLTIRLLHSYRAQTMQSRQDWLKGSVVERDANTLETTLPAEAEPVNVRVGLYLHRMGELSLKDDFWTAVFDIWFRWTGDNVHPGEDLEVVDGQIELREKKESYSQAGEQYARYRVRARILKDFDPSRFPFGDQGLVIQIENGKNDIHALRYVVDQQDIAISPEAVPSFLKITQSGVWVKSHSYAALQRIHSRFIFAMVILPPGVAVYAKLFGPLFASLAVTFIVLFITPIHVDPRFGLGVGAFFAIVANNIYVRSVLPVSDKISLADMVGAIGLATVFVILAQSAVSLYLFDTKGKEKLSSLFDKASFVVLLLGCVILNILLPLAARPQGGV